VGVGLGGTTVGTGGVVGTTVGCGVGGVVGTAVGRGVGAAVACGGVVGSGAVGFAEGAPLGAGAALALALGAVAAPWLFFSSGFHASVLWHCSQAFGLFSWCGARSSSGSWQVTQSLVVPLKMSFSWQ
jgi:hypothetical protein